LLWLLFVCCCWNCCLLFVCLPLLLLVVFGDCLYICCCWRLLLWFRVRLLIVRYAPRCCILLRCSVVICCWLLMPLLWFCAWVFVVVIVVKWADEYLLVGIVVVLMIWPVCNCYHCSVRCLRKYWWCWWCHLFSMILCGIDVDGYLVFCLMFHSSGWFYGTVVWFWFVYCCYVVDALPLLITYYWHCCSLLRFSVHCCCYWCRYLCSYVVIRCCCGCTFALTGLLLRFVTCCYVLRLLLRFIACTLLLFPDGYTLLLLLLLLMIVNGGGIAFIYITWYDTVFIVAFTVVALWLFDLEGLLLLYC
jgi:hypothetical protein